MPNAFFLYDGGNYKRGIDSGRERVPLTPQDVDPKTWRKYEIIMNGWLDLDCNFVSAIV